MACGVNGTTAAIRGALTPFANCKSATARRTTRTCCTPPLNSFLNAFWSLVVTSICRAGPAIPQVCAQTFLIGIVLLESFQAVKDLAEKIKKGQFKAGKLGGCDATMTELWNAALAA